MTPRQWLQLVASYQPELEGKPFGLVGHATRLSAEFPARVFTADAARAVAKVLHANAGYADIATALRHVMPERQAEANQTEEQRVARSWERFIGRRLAEGGDPAHLLSLVKAYCPSGHLRPILEIHFATALEEMDAKDRRIAEHQAKLRRVAEDAARRMQMPHQPRSRPVQPEPDMVSPKPRHLSGEALAAVRRKLGVVPLAATSQARE